MVTVTLMRAGVINENGYSYTREALENLVEGIEDPTKKLVSLAAGGIAGDSYHPQLTDVAGVCRRLWVEGDDLKAEIEILDTDKGRLATMIMDEAVFRPRSLAKFNDDKEVVDMDMISIDMILSKDAVTVW